MAFSLFHGMCCGIILNSNYRASYSWYYLAILSGYEHPYGSKELDILENVLVDEEKFQAIIKARMKFEEINKNKKVI